MLPRIKKIPQLTPKGGAPFTIRIPARELSGTTSAGATVAVIITTSKTLSRRFACNLDDWTAVIPYLPSSCQVQGTCTLKVRSVGMNVPPTTTPVVTVNVAPPEFPTHATENAPAV
jgi:hypothetical protein